MELVGVHWELLLWALVLFRYVYPAQSAYVPAWAWRDLLSRFEREVREPDPNAEFRGSLVDDNVFAIDVKEWKLANLLEEKRKERLSHLGEGLESRAKRTSNSREGE